MIFKEYFEKYPFEQIWTCLATEFDEEEEIRHSYRILYESINALDPGATSLTIVISPNGQGGWNVANILEPQEELAGRDVVVECEDGSQPPTGLQIATLLLYWSSMYGYKTAKQQFDDFAGYMKDSFRGPYYEWDPENDDILSGDMVKYIFFEPATGSISDEELAAWSDVEDSEKNISASLTKLLLATGVSEVSELAKANIVFIFPDSWLTQYDRLSNAISGLEWKTKRAIARKDGECMGTVIKEYLHDEYTPYFIFSTNDDFLPEQAEFIDGIPARHCLGLQSTGKAVKTLNRFDNVDYYDLYPGEREREEEAKRVNEIIERSLQKKRLRYWRSTILGDYTYDYSANLIILKKKLEYNIGYWKYVQRHVGWKNEVNRMQTACDLLEIAASDDAPREIGYTNDRNASRYGMLSPTDSDPEMKELNLWKLYQKKAFRILWRLLDHNMKRWWD